MFRLNGDIIKQLQNIYGIKFRQKYKVELKERILDFLNYVIKKHQDEDYFKTLSNIRSFLEIQNNQPYSLTKLFFKVYKEELFSSFNPIWYIGKEIEITYTKRQLQFIYLRFLIDSFDDLNIKYDSVRTDLYNNQLDKISFNKLYGVENVNFSKKLYEKLYSIFMDEIYNLFLTSFFKDIAFEELFIKIEHFVDKFEEEENNKVIDLYSEETGLLFKEILEEFPDYFCINLSNSDFFKQQRLIKDVYRFYYFSKMNNLFKKKLNSF